MVYIASISAPDFLKCRFKSEFSDPKPQSIDPGQNLDTEPVPDYTTEIQLIGRASQFF
jgi:hypothetical protein